MSAELEFWKKLIVAASDEYDLEMTETQLEAIAESVASGHQNLVNTDPCLSHQGSPEHE